MSLELLNLKVREAKECLSEIEWSAANGQHATILRDALRISELASAILWHAISMQRRLDVNISPMTHIEGAALLGNIITRKP